MSDNTPWVMGGRNRSKGGQQERRGAGLFLIPVCVDPPMAPSGLFSVCSRHSVTVRWAAIQISRHVARSGVGAINVITHVSTFQVYQSRPRQHSRNMGGDNEKH